MSIGSRLGVRRLAGAMHLDDPDGPLVPVVGGPDMLGFYCLVTRLDGETEISVGRKGLARLPRGFYVYCGSALGGVGARLSRHLRVAKRTHWHVDYLLAHATVVETWAGPSTERLECLCASLLRAFTGAETAFPGFGASDCRCPGHLVWLPARPSWAEMKERLGVARPGTKLYLVAMPDNPGSPTGLSREPVLLSR